MKKCKRKHAKDLTHFNYKARDITGEVYYFLNEPLFDEKSGIWMGNPNTITQYTLVKEGKRISQRKAVKSLRCIVD